MLVFPWPNGEYNPVLDEALTIAMEYLELTGRAQEYNRVQAFAALVILKEWRSGVRHPIRLSNTAIVAIETDADPETLGAFRSSPDWLRK
jgi:hypothetical protein